MMDIWQSVNLLSVFPHAFFYGSVTIFGLLMGSFLNVVVYRLPLIIERPECFIEHRLNLCFPASHCPSCKHPLKYWQNIPLISWLILKGKCHFCHDAISIRYPLVEVFCALMFLGMSLLFITPWGLFSALRLCWLLLALSLIDFSTYLLPDTLTLPLLWSGLLINSFSGEVTLHDAFYGAVAGYLALWCLYWGVKLLSGKEGMGYGDFKLLAALGAWIGWQALPYVCIIAALAGIIFSLGRSAIYKTSGQIPFGPFLALAGAAMYISQESKVVWLMLN